jgi:hypothetical protein
MALSLPGVTWSAVYGFTGGSYLDESVNGNTLSAITGSPSFVIGRNGTGSSALQGSTGTILGRTGALAGFNPSSNQLSLSAWIKTTSTGNELLMSMGRSPSSFEGEWIWGISNGQLYFWDYQGSNGFPATFTSTTSVNNGQWRHVAFVRNGLAGTFYVDGIPAGSMTAAKNVSYSNSVLALGGDYRDNNGFWTGQLDDVSVSSTALTAAQILLLAADASVPGVETGPTTSISGLTQTSVKLMGGITNLGGTTVTNAGFYLNTNSPATNGVKYSASGTTFSVGSFSNTITGLTPGTSYYYRAFAANSVGTGYGANEYSFTTPALSLFTTTNNPTGLTITGYSGTGGAVVIPGTIGTVAVTAIGQNAFQSKTSLTVVTIPEGVTAILDGAFAGCSGMTAITLPNSLTSIGNYAFDGCSNLGGISIPASVASIGANAFAWCSSLSSIILPSGLNKIQSGTFWTCTNLSSITIPGSVNEIQYNAFLNCSKLASVYFQENTPPTIGGNAFAGIAIGAKGYYPATAALNWAGVAYPGITIRSTDQTAPLITLFGSSLLTIYKGSIFTDPGATVADNIDAPRTITGNGAVNTGIIGVYTVTYTAQDLAGNLAVPVTREVVVVDAPNTPPNLANIRIEGTEDSPLRFLSPRTNYNFDDGTLQGWHNRIWDGTGWTDLPANVFTDSRISGDDGLFVPAGSRVSVSGNTDTHNNVLWLRSPEFLLTGAGDLTVDLYRGGAVSPAPTNQSEIPAVALSENSWNGWRGVALCRVRDGAYVLVKPRTDWGENVQTVTFTEAELAPYVNGDLYTLDLLNTGKGGWGWIEMDSVSIPGSSLSAFSSLYTDAENNPLVSITIQTLPLRGSLTLAGAPVTANQVISDVDIGFLAYTSNPNTYGDDSFQVTASDGTNSSIPATITVAVAAVNDSPTLTGESILPIAQESFANSNLTSGSIGGSAFISQGECVLTPAVSGQQGYLALNPLGSASPNAFTAEFEYRAYDGNGADGTSFNYGYFGSGFPSVYEHGLGSGLVVKFIEYARSRIEVVYNGNELASVPFSLMDPNYRTVVIQVDDLRRISVSIGGTPVVSNVALPEAYAMEDKSNWQFVWGARCGGANNKHSLKNLSIRNVSPGIPTEFTLTEDVPGNLVFSGTPFADADSLNLTVTLSIQDGTITANPVAGVIVGGTETARTFAGTVGALNAYFTTPGRISYVGSPNNAATRNLTVAVTDGGSASSQSIAINFTSVNDEPTLAAIPASYSGGFNQTQTIPLSVSDVETPATLLVFTASSSNTNLFPNGNLAVRQVLSAGTGIALRSMASTTSGVGIALGGGSDISWELVATPATGESGEADITVTVTDGGGALASRTFHITVLDAYTTWANQYFGQSGGNTVPTADPDGDGATNQQEFAAGTNPNDPSSHPEYFVFDPNTGTITGYSGPGGEVVIPSVFGGVAVTKIGDNAFQGMLNLTGVVIPESVTSIGSNAFFFCTNLASIVIPDSVLSIGENAFWNCHELKSATIGNGVTTLPRNAFSECWELTSVTLGANVKTLGDYAFNNCAKLKSIIFPAGFESMGAYAFALCADLTTITLPESVSTIGVRAFQQCTKLTAVYFQGSTPPSLGAEAFRGIASGAAGYYPATALANWAGFTYPGIAIRSNDQTAPVITLVGANSLTIYKGSVFTDPGATVTDNVDTTRTIVGSGGVNTGTVGVYTVTYTASDASGNMAVPVTRTVNVVIDPTIDTDGDGLADVQEAALGTNPLLADTDGDGASDKLEVDLRNSPTVFNVYNRLINGSFEDGTVKPSPGNWRPVAQDDVPGWKTTANNSYTIELWYSGFMGSSGNSGNTLAELNYNASGTLYQDVTMTVNSSVSYSFLHRGRDGNDVMDFKIDELSGGPGTSVAKNKFTRRVTTGTSWVRYSGTQATDVEVGKTYRFSYTSISPTGGSGNLLDDASFGIDQDGDGLLDYEEATLGTNPLLSDTDGDGFSDGIEVKAGSSPTSAYATPMPEIVTYPVGATKELGQSHRFEVVASGAGLSFRWKKDGVDFFGGSNSYLELPSLMVSDSGSYTVTVSNSYGSVTSPAVYLSVTQALISSGFSHTLYLATGASNVTAWGLNTDGRLGVGDTNSPVNWARTVQGIPAGATITQLSAGGTHSLILASEKVYVAGSDRHGQLGQGAVNGATKASFTPVVMTSDIPSAVAAGGSHSLIVTTSGKVFACGDNTYGQLAQSSTIAGLGTFGEVVFPGLTNRILTVAAGADHNLALDENGGVWVWGRNDSGQLGKNTRTTAERTPVRILSSGAKSVAAGFAHSLILKQDGTVLGFGRNTLAQAGQGSAITYAKSPTPISGLNGIQSISAGTDSSFAITGSGQLYSWGYNSFGELLLGYASPISSPAVYGPTPSPICINISNVSGGGYSSLAVGSQGVIFAGRNDMGQAGNGPDPDMVVGDYIFEAGNLTLGNLTMDLAGTTETLYDQIFVGQGKVTLNGILNLMFVGTYTGPVYGSTQTFDLIWARDGIVLGKGYATAFTQSGYLVESVVMDKDGGKVLQATVRAVVTEADLAKAANLARPSLDEVVSTSFGGASGTGVSTLSVSSGVEMIYSYERPTGGVTSGAEYFVDGINYRVEQSSSLSGSWLSASLSGTTVTSLGNGRERVSLRINSSGTTGFLRLAIETP